jgi:hypothetical protein
MVVYQAPPLSKERTPPMPITQEQVMSLITAGEALQSVLNNLSERLRLVISGESTDANQVRNLVQSVLFQSYEEASSLNLNSHIINLGKWREHYNYRYKANVSNRLKQQQRRQPLPTAPMPEGEVVDIDIDDIDKELAESIGGVSIKQIEETALKLHAEGNLPQPEDLHKIIADDRVIAYVKGMYERGLLPPKDKDSQP